MRRVRRTLARLPRRSVPGVVILLYHRVVELDHDPFDICVTPAHFEEHLQVLRARGSVMGLQDLIAALARGRAPSRGTVVTFDDGYADNAVHAKPLLDRYEVPAAFFPATGYLGSPREFWWDSLERILLQPGQLPPELALTIAGRTHRWKPAGASAYDEEAFRSNREWRLAGERDPTPRHQVFRALYSLLQEVSDDERTRTMMEVFAWAGMSEEPRPTHRVMSHGELRDLAREDSALIGSHSVTHSMLAGLGEDQQEAEILQSKHDIEDLLGRPVTAFSYPYGSRAAYSATTMALVRSAGYRCACVGFAGAIRRGTDPYELPRCVVTDRDGEGFATWLQAIDRWLTR